MSFLFRSIFSNFSFNSDFALRAIMDSDALTTLLKFLMIMIFCMSYIIHLCERTITPTFYTDGTFTVAQGHWTQSYFAAIWITFFSFTTLGYGDILPITYCGRAASMMTVILGILLVSVRSAFFIQHLSICFLTRYFSLTRSGFDWRIQHVADQSAVRAKNDGLHVVGVAAIGSIE
jgi:hypothetical protein